MSCNPIKKQLSEIERRAIWAKALDQRSYKTPVAEALFVRVAKRALAPSSKLAIEQWAADEVFWGGHQPLQVQHFYPTMDFLIEHGEAIQKEVFWSTANLLYLTVT